MTIPPAIEGVLSRLIDHLRAHAAAVVSADTEAINTAAEALRLASQSYEDMVFDRCGAGSVFADRADMNEAVQGWLEEDDEPLSPQPGAQRVSITGRWDFLVTDPAALRQVDAGLENHLGNEAADDSAPANAVAALDTLATRAFVGLPGLESAGCGWSVRSIAQTLFDMTESKRDAVDF